MFWLSLAGHGVTKAETAINGYWPAGREIRDGVGARYKFRVVMNESPWIIILFGWNRFYGPGNETYLLECNLYADGGRYADGVCTTWPLQFTSVPASASLRIAVPDYNLHGWTGARTLDPVMFPRQTYLIDGIPNLWKTDMISQTNLNGVEGAVEISRGDCITDDQGWKCSGPLPTGRTYREWRIVATFGGRSYTNLYALPDEHARFLTSYETLGFGSEFFWRKERFKVFLWDLEVRRESQDGWRRINQWKVTRQDDAPVDYGTRVVRDQGRNVIEMSNDGPAPFLPKDAILDLSQLPAEDNPPDLAVIAFKTSAATVLCGDELTVITTVANLGTSASEGFRLGYFLSADRDVDAGDGLIGTEEEWPTGLAPTRSVTVTNRVAIGPDIEPGSYFLGALADYRGAVAELTKTNNASVATPLRISRCGLPAGDGSNNRAMPRDFSHSVWLREDVLDTRPGSTNGTEFVSTNLAYAGDLSLGNGSLVNHGPGYTAESFFPYVLLDTNRQWLLMHPAVNHAAAIGLTVCRTSSYQVSGAFGRANDARYAGDGVTVAVVLNQDLAHPLFTANLPASAAVNPADLFAGLGAASFDLTVPLVAGDMVRFLVFNGPPRDPDMGFDVTALRFEITEVARPDIHLEGELRGEALVLTWSGSANETYEVLSSYDFLEWRAVATVPGKAGPVTWSIPVTHRMELFRVRYLR